jgi:hypothetical protein
MLKITLGDVVVTRNEDEWAQTVRNDARLSAYPLAMWLASSWWRLRWEPLPTTAPSHAWRMAHELGAVGHGYVWPRMLFASEGDTVDAWAVQTPRDVRSPVRYLVDVRAEIGASEFELAIDTFVSGVLARLDAVSGERTTLHDLWVELVEERSDPKMQSHRRLEALLGYDPDESPQALMTAFIQLASSAGSSAISEVAAVCGSRDRVSTLKEIATLAESNGPYGRITRVTGHVARQDRGDAPGWLNGRELARSARNRLGLNGGPVTDRQLCELIGLSEGEAMDLRHRRKMPLGMAVRNPETGETKLLFRKTNLPGRRFEIARLLCDDLVADSTDRWLPMTDEKTSRQKIQRAFAAEFLCPIDSLKDVLSGDYSYDAVDQAAEHFGVSTRAVETQLVNHRLLPPETLFPFASGFDFPYYVASQQELHSR